MKKNLQKTTGQAVVAIIAAVLSVAPQGRATITTNLSTFQVGIANNDNNNSLFTTNVPFVSGLYTQLTSGAIQIGGSTITGGGGSVNTVILSNSLLITSADSFIGSGQSLGNASTNNSLTLLAGSVWNGGNRNLAIGSKGANVGMNGAGVTSNFVYISNGAVLSNIYVNISTNLGSTGPSYANGLVVSNGGFAQLNGLMIANLVNGTLAGTDANYAYISNITVAAGTQVSKGTIAIANGAMNNSGTFYNVMWTGNGGTLSVGAGKVDVSDANANALTLGNGSMFTNFGDIAVGYDRAPADFKTISNSIVVTDAKTVLSTAGNMLVGGAIAGNARNSNTRLIGGVTNSMSVLAGATVLSTNLFIGTVAGVGNGTANTSGTIAGGGNVVRVSGASTSWTNNGNAYVGAGLNFTIIGGNNIGFGGTIDSSGNKLVVDNGAIFWTTNLTLGLAADIPDSSGNNTYITTANNNQVIIGNGASVYTKLLQVGATNAMFTLPAGATGNANVGGANAAATGNSVTLSNNALLEVDGSMEILAGPSGGGNTISNYGSIFQFNSPSVAISPNGFGNIYMTNGTISYRGTAAADVTLSTNPASSLAGIQFAGTSTFMLNGASNTSAAANQTYIFQPNGSSPSNYVNLVMVNGQTAYGNGDLTIGNGGSFLVSNTTASITGLFTNNGMATVVNGTATFNNGLVNAGSLTLDPSVINGPVNNLATGKIYGNGLFSGNTVSLGLIAPGSAATMGTLIFGTNLTLSAGSSTQMKIDGVLNTNDLIAVGGLFTYGGTLSITDVNISAGLELTTNSTFQLFSFIPGNQTGDFAVTNLPTLSPGLAWNTSQLDTTGTLSIVAVVPEPSTIVLLLFSSLGLWTVTRRRRQV